MISKKKISIFAILIMMILLVTGCSKQTRSNGKIKIVTSTNVYANIAQNIVGKYGKAEAIIQKSTVDPHDFEPTTADAKVVDQADLVVANGLGYDSWMNNLASASNKQILLVGEDLMHLKKGDNPHIWYDLNMPTKYVGYLEKKLTKLDPTHKAYYKKNAKAYVAEVNKLKKMANSINGQNSKPVFVSEPVFDYALKAAGYKIGDKGFEEAIENDTDPSPKLINQMTNEINQRKIAFFVNNTQASSATVNGF
ncbi:MAG: zinc ABC transporter solute-binding protein, partial [Lactobacillus sp.]|nr:zinc ABC transporter solute-binding protein [Lactobacillus sp.]